MYINIKHTKKNWLAHIQKGQYSEIPKSLTKASKCRAGLQKLQQK